MVLLFLGPPGSGKDTQAKKLQVEFGFEVVSTGELIRIEMKNSSDLGLEAKSFYDAGLWIPDKLMYQIVQNYLATNEIEKIILTGAVRRASQIQMLDDSLKLIGKSLDKVFYFNLSDEVALDRIVYRVTDPETGSIYHLKYNPPPEHLQVEKRDLDQNLEATKSRLAEVRKYDSEIIEKYTMQGKLVNIDASRSIDEIYEEIKRVVKL